MATPVRQLVTEGLLVVLEAKPGKEDEVARFFESALPLVEEEPGTAAWFAICLGPTTFGIFDVFTDELAREAHLNGKVAAALMERAEELFSEKPKIQKLDVLAAKLPVPDID
jgi:quinol monooxygenase YgiN